MKWFIVFILAIVLVSGCMNNACKPFWNCTEWSECIRTGAETGNKTRTCADDNKCNIDTDKPSESQTCRLPKIAMKAPSEMVLQLSDLGANNWTVSERDVRTKDDMQEDDLQKGWKTGYYIKYIIIREQDLSNVTSVENYLSIYPIENISIVLIPRASDEDIIWETMPDPKIGDQSMAFRVRIKDAFDSEDVTYMIEFVKLNVYESLLMNGKSTDYGFLKNLAKKVEQKIE